MAADGSTIEFTSEDDVAYITLDNPPVNILTAPMMDEISDALEQVAADTIAQGRGLHAPTARPSAPAPTSASTSRSRSPEMIASFGRMFRRVRRAGDAGGDGRRRRRPGRRLRAGADGGRAAGHATAPTSASRRSGSASSRRSAWSSCRRWSGRAKAHGDHLHRPHLHAPRRCAPAAWSPRSSPAASWTAALAAVLKDLRRASPLVHAPEHAHAEAPARPAVRRGAGRGGAGLPARS